MSAEIIDGKLVAAYVRSKVKEEAAAFADRYGRAPGLAVIRVGDDPASAVYVRNKMKACDEVGFFSKTLHLPADSAEDEVIAAVEELNSDISIDAFLVQLPLPKHINESRVIEAIDPRKDVDGFHPENVGRMVLGLDSFVSATPYGIVALLDHYGIETKGKHCVVLGRSNIVGRPIANLLSQKAQPGDCTVTICHSRTKDIAAYTREADIIIAALGVPEFLKGDMVKEGVVVVDVGITRVADSSEKGYHLVGDVAFDEVAPKASYITPVPGGVGPMTIVSLLKNTLKAASKR